MFRQRAVAVAVTAAVGFAGVIGLAFAAPAVAASPPAAVTLPSATQAVARQCAVFQVNASGGLNVRSGPGTEFSIVGSLSDGGRYLFSRRVQNGFRELADEGRWASDRFLVLVGPWGNCPA